MDGMSMRPLRDDSVIDVDDGEIPRLAAKEQETTSELIEHLRVTRDQTRHGLEQLETDRRRINEMLETRQVALSVRLSLVEAALSQVEPAKVAQAPEGTRPIRTGEQAYIG